MLQSWFKASATTSEFPPAENIALNTTAVRIKQPVKKRIIESQTMQPIETNSLLSEFQLQTLTHKLDTLYASIMNLFLTQNDQIKTSIITLEQSIAFATTAPEMIKNSKDKITKLNVDLEEEACKFRELISKLDQIRSLLRQFTRIPKSIADSLDQYCELTIDFSLKFNEPTIIEKSLMALNSYRSNFSDDIVQLKKNVTELTDFILDKINQRDFTPKVKEELDEKKRSIDEKISYILDSCKETFHSTTDSFNTFSEKEYLTLNLAFCKFYDAYEKKLPQQQTLVLNPVAIKTIPNTEQIKMGELSSSELMHEMKKIDAELTKPDQQKSPVVTYSFANEKQAVEQNSNRALLFCLLIASIPMMGIVMLVCHFLRDFAKTREEARDKKEKLTLQYSTFLMFDTKKTSHKAETTPRTTPQVLK